MVRHFPDIGYTVVAEAHSHHVSFKVYEVFGTDSNGIVLWKASDTFGNAPCDKLEDAEVYLHGDVKWDGCSNWHFDEQDRVMLHGCSRGDLTNIGEVMARCWDWTKEVLPNFLD